MRLKKCNVSVARGFAVACFVMLMAGCAGWGPSVLRPPHQPDYVSWNGLLARIATPEGVRYDVLIENAGMLYEAVEDLRCVRPEDYEAMSLAERQAFLINAHNAFALARIVSNWPVETFEDTRAMLSARNADDIRLAGRQWSLAELAEALMTEPFHDARSIFMLNWCERGCAPLPPFAVTGDNLEKMLTRQTRAVFASADYYQYDSVNHIIRVTPFLDEYKEAIDTQYISRWVFLERYLPRNVSKKIKKHRPRIRYLPFDTSLNAAPGETVETAVEASPVESGE